MDLISRIQAKARNGNFLVSLHAADEMGEEQIPLTELLDALSKADLVENYPNDARGASCLVLGWTAARRPLHVVVGWLEQPMIKIITVYRPDLRPDKWESDWKTRRVQP